MKTNVFYGILACSKTRVRCKICGVFIPKANKCIEQHTNGAKHKNNIYLMNENGITFSNDTLYCKPCKISLPDEESVAIHIVNEDHSNWMAAVEDLVDGEFITLDAYLSCEKEDAYCEVCKSDIHCSLHTLEEHVNHIHHRTNIIERLKPVNAIFSVDNNDEVWCKICDAYIENDVQSILYHIDGDDQHIEWFALIEDLIEGEGVTIEQFLANEHENNAYCQKCQMEVPCIFQSIESHILSEAHLNVFV